MNVLIIEDEIRAAKRLKNLITSIEENINVLSILDGIDNSVQWFRNNPHPDLLFLDIQLSDGLSFNIFKQVNVNCPVVFTTAYDEYALKAFELNSIDYLLKPINIEKLKKSIDKYHKLKQNFISGNFNPDLNKILSNLSMNSKVYKSRFLINKPDSLVLVNTSDIAYFYAEEKVTFIITKDNKRHILDDSLDKTIIDLDPSQFYRINRQVIVSINCISKINNYFNYKLKLDLTPKRDNLNTVISRAKVKEFKEWVSK